MASENRDKPKQNNQPVRDPVGLIKGYTVLGKVRLEMADLYVPYVKVLTVGTKLYYFRKSKNLIFLLNNKLDYFAVLDKSR